MYQQITIIGNLGKDPVSKQSQSGKQFATISVAASRSLGQGQKETVWFSVTAWEKTAQYLINYAQKGSLVLVTGRIVGDQFGCPRIWTDNNGNARASFEVTANDVKILSGFRSEDQRNQTPTMQSQPTEPAAHQRYEPQNEQYY